MTRRSLFSTLLTAPLTRLASKIGRAKPAASLKPVNQIPAGRPCAYPTQYTVHFAQSLTMARMYEVMAACSFGRLQPMVISMNGRMTRELYGICPEIFHWHTHSEMSARGWMTYPFNGAEVVEDRQVKDGIVWFITPGQDDPRYHAELVIGPGYAMPQQFFHGRPGLRILGPDELKAKDFE